jgi:ABC-2 type transport system permease protein
VSARATRLVVEREVREAARRKGIWAMVVLTFLGGLAVVVLPELLSGGEVREVVVVGDDQLGVAAALGGVADPEFETSRAGDRASAVAMITGGDADLAIVLGDPPTLIAEDESAGFVGVAAAIVGERTVAARLTEAGIDPGAVGDAFAAGEPRIEPVDVEREGREGAAFAVSFVLYLLTVLLTSQVANGVAVEKSNRVSEVLLAIVPPRSLLFGKVIGVGCIGLVTLAAAATPVVVRLVTGGDVPAGLGPTLAASAIFFVGGLALYLILAGSLGALVSRQEEVGAVVAPLTIVLVAGYLVAVSAGESAVSTVLAFVPLTSPMIEPYRIALGIGSAAEYVASATILVVSAVLAARFGAVVFRRAIVRTGRRLTLRDVL